jgi:hypothetical protein
MSPSYKIMNISRGLVFHNFKAISATRIQNWHLYTTHIHETWTLIQPISKKIKVEANLSHLITHTQYLIRLTITCIIHRSQGWTFDFLTFDPSGIHHHGLTYTTLFCVREKENLYLLAPLVEANFKVDKCVSNEMQCFKKTTQWQLCVPYLQPFIKTHTIIQSLNTRSLLVHFQNTETDHNLQTSHILCLNEIKFKTQNKSSHQYSNHSKYKSIVTFGSQVTMLLYDISIVLDSCESVIMSRWKFIVASFNTDTCRAIHIIAVYKPPYLSLTIFYLLFKS